MIIVNDGVETQENDASEAEHEHVGHTTHTSVCFKMASSVKVAVRVRPFNGREKDMGAKLCIRMRGKETTIFNETGEKPFAFDHSYWSHDQFIEESDGYMRPVPGGPYAD